MDIKGVELVFRVEDKYLLSENERCILDNRLSLFLDCDRHDTLRNGYSVSSIYFDDYCNSNYHDTISGIPDRVKYRIRIYNNSLDTIKAEVKYKHYNRVRKYSQRITESQMHALLNKEVLKDNFDNSASAIQLFNIAILKKSIAPKIIVAYDRKAYINNSGNVRITLDSNLRFSNDIDSFGNPNTVNYDNISQGTILEVKYDEFCPNYIMQLLETNNLTQTAYSKYGKCMEGNNAFNKRYY